MDNRANQYILLFQQPPRPKIGSKKISQNTRRAIMKRIKSAVSKRLQRITSNSDTKTTASTDHSKTPPEPETYYHIPLGSGGLLSAARFNRTIWETRYIGTSACVNSVGVFFEISDQECFAAHIDAFVIRHAVSSSSLTSSSSGDRNHSSAAERLYTLNDTTSARLRTEILRRLGLAVPGGRRKRMRETLVLTGQVTGKGSVGSVVAKAVREFLGVVNDAVVDSGTAFVALWPDGDGFVFENGLPEGWDEVDCGLGEGDWKIEILEREG
ncbi:hypothetical protein Q7P37_008622 [Cladosporium fusiforme]